MPSNKKFNLEELKVLVFEEDHATKQNKDKLFKLAKAAKDVESIEKLRDNFSFKSATIYLQKLNSISLEKVLKTRDIEMLKILVKKEIDISTINIINLVKGSYTIEFIRILIDTGADLNITDTDGNTSLMIASSQGQYDIVQLLVEKKAKLDLQNHHGFTAIMMAFTRKKIYRNIIEFLINSGADVNKTDKKYNINALTFACDGDEEQLQSLLIKHTNDLNVLSTTGNSALLDAVNSNMLLTAELLLNNGANIDIQNNTNGITPLMIACTNKNEKMIELLLDYKPDLYILDSNGMSVTEYAVMALNYNILKLLLDNGAYDIKVPKLRDHGINSTLNDDEYNKRMKLASAIPPLTKKLTNILKSKKIAEQFVISEFYTCQSMGIMKELLERHEEVTKSIKVQSLGQDDKVIEATNLFYKILNDIEPEAKLYVMEVLLENIMQSYSIGIFGENTYKDIVYDKYKNYYKYKLTLENQYDGKAFIDVYEHRLIFHFLNTNGSRSSDEYKLVSKNKYFDERKGHILIIKNYLIEMSHTNHIRISTFIMKDEFDNIISPVTNNPKLLVTLLTNFTIDTPIKYTTHEWKNRVDEKYRHDFELFLGDALNQLNELNPSLEELSPNLYKKINYFLATKDLSSESWHTGIPIGWSSLEGLKEIIDSGQEPFKCLINPPLTIGDSVLSEFGQVIELFKNTIEIRSNMLQDIFLHHQERLGKEFGRKFKLNISDSLKGEKFYTDVETLKNAISDIFKEIEKYAHENDAYQVDIKLHKPTTEYIALHIIHVNSHSNRSADELLQRIKLQKGDSDLAKQLKNLCDWSIESMYDNEAFKIDCFEEEVIPNETQTKPQGYTHILRFYK